MMEISGSFINWICLAGITGFCGFLLHKSSSRRAIDVIADLVQDENVGLKKTQKSTRGSVDLRDEMAGMGLFESTEKKRFEKLKLLIFFIPPCIVILVRVSFGLISLSGLVFSLVGTIALSYLAIRYIISSRTFRFKRSLEYFLPVVMERMVMAVESGLDIVPAVSTVIEMEYKTNRQSIDPVTRLLGYVKDLCESGLSFEQALSEIASKFDCSALRHAFIHLGLAHKEGGALVGPLRELSDSTQLYYQETIEEEIAKMPVKATLPLLITFAGLIICFITIPLTQVMTFTSKAKPDAEQSMFYQNR